MIRRLLPAFMTGLVLQLANTSLAQCPQDDPAANNDCASALPLATGTTTGFAVQDTLGDFFEFTLAPKTEATIDALFDSTPGDIDLLVYDDAGSCSSTVAFSSGVGDNDTVSVLNCTGEPHTYTLLVSMLSGSCNDYDLVLNVTNYTISGCTDGSSEENDTPLSAAFLANGGQSGPFYSLFCDEDWFVQTVPAFQELETRVDRFDSNDLSAQFYDASGTTVLANSTFESNGDQVLRWVNTTAQDTMVMLRVAQQTENGCSLYYTLSTTTILCGTFPDDALEDNDDCLSSIPLAVGFTPDLFCRDGDEDYYSFVVPGEERFQLFTLQTEGTDQLDFDLFFDDGTCSVTAGTNAENYLIDETFGYENATSSPVGLILRVRSSFGGCTRYNLSWNTFPSQCAANEDSLEDNDDCSSALPLPLGTTSALSVRPLGVDEDWFSIDLDADQLLRFRGLFNPYNGMIVFRLYDSCGGAVLASSTGSSPVEFQYLNSTGASQSLRLVAFVDPQSNDACNSYSTWLEVIDPTALGITPLCFGDGSGTPCPCYNNSSTGHIGGCAFLLDDFSFADGATLTGTGTASVAMDSLRFDLTGAMPDSFALLVSGDNALPVNDNCAGCGVTAFEGLRCAGGNFLRHGVRALNTSGDATNGWGPPNGPGGGLVQASGFTAGQTRTFFSFFRVGENTFCGEGQNSSNGVSVTFFP